MQKANNKEIAIFKFARDWGGGEQYSKLLALELEKNGYNVSIITNNKKLAELPVTKTRFFTRAPEVKNKKNALTGAVRLPVDMPRYNALVKKLAQDGVSIAIIQDLNEKILLPRILKKNNINVIFVEHTNWEPSLVKHPLFPLIRKNARYIDAIISPSNNLLTQINRYKELADKSALINHGLPPQTPCLNAKEVRLVIVSRLSKEKGVDRAIKALGNIDNKKTQLVIIGDGPQKIELANLAQKIGVADRVNIIGYKKDPYDYISKNDIYLCTSRIENYPLSIIEAISAGLVVIAPDIPGIQEIIPENQLFHNTSDNNITDKINKLLSDEKQRAKIKIENTDLYKKRYNINVMIKKFINLISQYE